MAVPTSPWATPSRSTTMPAGQAAAARACWHGTGPATSRHGMATISAAGRSICWPPTGQPPHAAGQQVPRLDAQRRPPLHRDADDRRPRAHHLEPGAGEPLAFRPQPVYCNVIDSPTHGGRAPCARRSGRPFGYQAPDGPGSGCEHRVQQTGGADRRHICARRDGAGVVPGGGTDGSRTEASPYSPHLCPGGRLTLRPPTRAGEPYGSSG
jgi:hypothetical protein